MIEGVAVAVGTSETVSAKKDSIPSVVAATLVVLHLTGLAAAAAAVSTTAADSTTIVVAAVVAVASEAVVAARAAAALVAVVAAALTACPRKWSAPARAQ